jgi:hypothetical protein
MQPATINTVKGSAPVGVCTRQMLQHRDYGMTRERRLKP